MVPPGAGEVIYLSDYRAAAAENAQPSKVIPREYMVLLPDGNVRIALYVDDATRAMELLTACTKLQSAVLRLVAGRKKESGI